MHPRDETVCRSVPSSLPTIGGAKVPHDKSGRDPMRPGSQAGRLPCEAMRLDRLRHMYRRYEIRSRIESTTPSAFDDLLGRRRDCNPNRSLARLMHHAAPKSRRREHPWAGGDRRVVYSMQQQCHCLSLPQLSCAYEDTIFLSALLELNVVANLRVSSCRRRFVTHTSPVVCFLDPLLFFCFPFLTCEREAGRQRYSAPRYAIRRA